jgi:hydrogenase-4 component F
VFTVKYGTKQMSGMRDGLRLLPWSGPLFLLSVFALSALPPSGIFRSEFEIVAGGLSSGTDAAAAALVILVTVAFFGLTASATGMLLTAPPVTAPPADPPADGGRTPEQGDGAHADGTAVAVLSRVGASGILSPGEPSAWMVVPVLAGLAVLVLLGVHPPGELTNLITRAVAQLRGTP